MKKSKIKFKDDSEINGDFIEPRSYMPSFGEGLVFYLVIFLLLGMIGLLQKCKEKKPDEPIIKVGATGQSGFTQSPILVPDSAGKYIIQTGIGVIRRSGPEVYQQQFIPCDTGKPVYLGLEPTHLYHSDIQSYDPPEFRVDTALHDPHKSEALKFKDLNQAIQFYIDYTNRPGWNEFRYGIPYYNPPLKHKQYE